MKKRLLFLLPLGFLTATHSLLAQGTAFTYQGQLQNNGSPANGSYALVFTLYNTNTTGVPVAGPVTNSAVAVTNGLFTVLIDFGASPWNGQTNWLEIGVETNGSSSFTTLVPRQQLSPTPYAIFAESSSNLLGALPAASFGGTYGNAVMLNNAGNSFTGNGSGLTGLNASQLTSGTVADARLASDVAFTDAIQTFTADNTFSGPGQSLVINGNSGISTSLFTGLGLQNYASSGESAIMSSYNDGFGYLTFYTKQGFGYPIAKQVMIDKYGGVAIDQQGNNNGVIDNGTTNGVGLTFGIASGEGIASQRKTGANQNGLDFYTSSTKRMSINSNGFVGIGTATAVNPSDTQFELYSPTTNNYDGMWIATGAGGLPFYGYSEGGGYTAWTVVDGSDGNKWKVYDNGYWLTVTPSGDVGINTTTPTENLEINGTSRLDGYDVYLRAAGDYNHGLGYRGSVNGGTIYVDGPFLYGFNGGCLGVSDPDTAVLQWSYTGNVWISNNLSTATLTISDGMNIDQGNLNVGNDYTNALTFGASSGEGIGSQRTGGSTANGLYGLEFYTEFARRMTILQNGNVGIGSTNPAYLLVVGSSTSPAYCNGTTWENGSDRDSKQDFAALDPRDVLEKVSTMPITEWQYKVDPAGVKHIGPMAQDFYAAFGLNGVDDKHISTVDEGGIALAAIQGLNRKLEETRAESKTKDAEIEKLKAKADKVDSLEKRNDSLSARLNDLEATVRALAEKK